jgi:hypothetical protein
MDSRDDADGITVRDGQIRLDTSFPLFTARMNTRNGWEHAGEPQRDPLAACMLLAAAIWKQDPAVCLTGLQAQVDGAVSALRNGARKVTIGDDGHRVERTDVILDIPFHRHFTKP